MIIKENLPQILSFADTPPQTQSVELLSVPPISRAAPVPSAPPIFNYENNSPPLSRQPIELPSLEPRETSFGDFGTISPLRNKLPNIVPLSSKPNVHIFQDQSPS